MGTDPRRFATSEELLAEVQRLVAANELDEALAAVAHVEEDFCDDPLARHLAGLVWERVFLEAQARGEVGSLDLYENAEHHYRAALRCDPDNSETHAERLFACLFVLGTQRGDRERLLEGLELGLRLRDGAEGDTRAILQRETAVIASAHARLTDEPADWQLADTLFGDCEEPPLTREQFFFHFYRGLVKRALAGLEPTHRAEQLALAVASFRAAGSVARSRLVDYHLADTLLLAEDLNDSERADLARAVADLTRTAPESPDVTGLQRRYEARFGPLPTEPATP